MATHTRGPRKRKSRSGQARPSAMTPRSAPASPPRSPAGTTTFGERPRAPWHPLPLSEILILAGAIGAAAGWLIGFAGRWAMLAGIAAVALGTIEVTLREHRAGFRSHALLLSLIPVVAFHTAVVLLFTAVASAPRWLNAVVLAFDAVLFFALFKLLRARFATARTRVAAGAPPR